MYVGGRGGFYLEVVCTHTALWTYVVGSNAHTIEWLCVRWRRECMCLCCACQLDSERV